MKSETIKIFDGHTAGLTRNSHQALPRPGDSQTVFCFTQMKASWWKWQATSCKSPVPSHEREA
jgi:hypothetical protein